MSRGIKNIGLYLLLVALSGLFLTGCVARSKGIEVVKDDEEDKILIGFSFDTFIMERWERDRDVFVSKANELGVEVNIQSANGEVAEQRKQIEYFIETGCDVIVIVPVDSDLLSDEVQRAKEMGIKVVAYDRMIIGGDVDLYITFDNRKVGEFMAEAIYEGVGEGANVVRVNGPLTDANVTVVNEGFDEIADKYGFTLVDEINCTGWDQDTAYQYVIDNIDMIKEADAIVCGNDALASKVIQGLSEHRLAGNIIVTGQDAELESCQHIVEGTQTMTVYKPINELAETAATYIVDLANEETLPYTGEIFDGIYYVPYVAIKPYSVNKDNIDRLIIDTGFHQKEEVYLNLNN